MEDFVYHIFTAFVIILLILDMIFFYYCKVQRILGLSLHTGGELFKIIGI